MGADRVGWYSYDFIDYGGRPSATKILPQFQNVEIDQAFPAIPGVTDAFIVAEVLPEQSLVLIVPEKGTKPIVIWAFQLDQIDCINIHLIVRAKVSASWQELARNSKSDDRIIFINQSIGYWQGYLYLL